MSRSVGAGGVVVPHSSGARIVVDELAIVRAGDTALAGAAPPFRAHEVRARPLARPRDLQRWLLGAAARVVDPRREEEERAVAFWWLTNDALGASIEALLVAGIHDTPLDGDVPPRAPEAGGPWTAFVTQDGAGVTLDALALRFSIDGAPVAALHAWVAERGPAHVVAPSGDVDAPLLVYAMLRGPPVGPASLEPFGDAAAALRLACVAPAPGGAPLEALVRAVVAGVSWRETATPTLGP